MGGNKTTNYNASINYIERDGAIHGVGNNLFTARTYAETKVLKERLLIGVGLNANVRNEWGVNDRGNDGKSVYNAMYYYSPLNPTKNEDGTWYADNSISQYYNPLAMIYERQSQATFKRIQATGKLQLKIIDGLLLNANFNYQNKNYSFKSYNSHQDPIDHKNGEASRKTTTDIYKMLEIYANYDKTFGQVHKLSLMAGYSWEEQRNGEGFGAKGYNFYDDAIGWDNIGLANSWDVDPVWGEVRLDSKMISFYARANYSFDSKYIVQAAVRRDGSSNFGTNHKWYLPLGLCGLAHLARKLP